MTEFAALWVAAHGVLLAVMVVRQVFRRVGGF